MIQIVEASEEYIEAIVGLWKEMMDYHATLSPFYALTDDAPRHAERFLRNNMKSPDSLVLVALKGTKVVAFSLSFITRHPPVLSIGEYGFISDFAVTGPCRGRGVGTMMAQHIKDWFSDRGVSRIELRVSTFNAVGRPFWEKLGFTEYEAVMCFHGGITS